MPWLPGENRLRQAALYAIGLPQESDEVWAQADCRFAAAIYADPERWKFIGECHDCGLPEHNSPPRPPKWRRFHFYLRPRPGAKVSGLESMNAQDLLGRPDLYPLPGISVEYADPGCLDYYHIPRRK